MALMTAERTNGNFGMTVTDATGHKMIIDIPVDQGGQASGFRPMQTLLAAVCGCSSVDVVMILNKQKQDLRSLKISVDGNREEGKEPSLWQNIQVDFEMTGDLEPSKAYRAAELSVNKYCSVIATLRKAGADVTFTVTVNGVKYNNDPK